MKAKVLDLLISDNNPNTTTSIAPLLISVLFLSVLSGILAAFGNVILLIALLGLFGLLFVLAAPVAWTIWIIFLAAFLITGPSAFLDELNPT